MDEQRFMFARFFKMMDERKPDALFIGGDVYDKSQPSGEAVLMLDDFLTQAVSRTPVFMISGNHDSAERLSFANRLLKKNGLMIESMYRGALKKETMEDAFGEVDIFMLPFVKPIHVKNSTTHTQPIESTDDAVRAVIRDANIDPNRRNVLLAHQFVVSGSKEPERSDSETVSVGGSDAVDAECFKGFDYVALGHLHRAQSIGRDTIRYAGSPIKYSLSEALHQKSAALVEIRQKGVVDIELIPLIPDKDLRRIKGPLKELLFQGQAAQGKNEDYIYATLTDEEEMYDAIGQLKTVYPNILHLSVENERTKRLQSSEADLRVREAEKSMPDLFSEFYFEQNAEELSEKQRQRLKKLFDAMEAGDIETD